jgi:hypothetical protein
MDFQVRDRATRLAPPTIANAGPAAADSPTTPDPYACAAFGPMHVPTPSRSSLQEMLPRLLFGQKPEESRHREQQHLRISVVQVGPGQKLRADHFQAVASRAVASRISDAVSIARSMTSIWLEIDNLPRFRFLSGQFPVDSLLKLFIWASDWLCATKLHNRSAAGPPWLACRVLAPSPIPSTCMRQSMPAVAGTRPTAARVSSWVNTSFSKERCQSCAVKIREKMVKSAYS